MPEFRFSGTLDGVPSELRPGDGRIGSALAAAPVSVAGRALTVGQAIARAVAVITRTTTTAVPNWTAVVGDGDGGCKPADPTNPDHFGRVLGIVASGAASGNDVQIQAIGDLIGSAPHGLVLGAVVYVGLAGALAPTPPDGIQWRQIVGKASTDRSLVVALGEASLVTDDADAMIGETGFSVQASRPDVDQALPGRWVDPRRMAEGVSSFASRAARGSFNDAPPAIRSASRAMLGVFYPVVELGYVGDGQRHPLSSVTQCQGQETTGWTLQQWKTLFPKALSLNDEIDGLAVQRFWDLRPKGGRLRLPDGFGFSSYEIQTGGAQCVSYTGTHRDTCGLIFVNSLASGGSGFGVSHGRLVKADGTFEMQAMSLLCSGGAFQTALTVRFSGEQFNSPWCHLMDHVMIKGFNQTFFAPPLPPNLDYWRQATVTYDIVRGLSWYDVVSISPNPEINPNDHHTLIVDYVNRASNSYNYFNCCCYGGAYGWKFNYDGKATTQTHEEAQFWNCQGYDVIGLCSNRTVNYSAPYSDNWTFYECQCACRGGPIYDFERTELVSVYGGLYGNNIALNSLQTMFARIRNCAAVRIKDIHMINAAFGGAAQNFYHIYVEGPGNKEIIVEDYTVTNYGNFGAFVGFTADVPPGAYRDSGVQFNVGAPEPGIQWVEDLSNAQFSELRVRKLLAAAKAAGYVTAIGMVLIDNAGNCVLKDQFTATNDASGDQIYNFYPGLVRKSPICTVDNANILQPVGNVQPGVYAAPSFNESVARVRMNYPGGANKLATTSIEVSWPGG